MALKFDNIDNMVQQSGEEKAWEIYHENSKVTRYNSFPSQAVIYSVMERMKESLFYDHYHNIALPDVKEGCNIDVNLLETISNRESEREFSSKEITMEDLSKLLNYSYGVNRNYKDKGFARLLRYIPSGGGLYPLELYFFANNIKNLEKGLYHFQSEKNSIQRLNLDIDINKISKCMVQPELFSSASLILFVSAVFSRAYFKYSERSYRFILMESGHLMQNYNLVSTALGYKSVNVGGFYDYELDELFGFDGLTQSIIYLNCLGV
jgi:SagB-type dehydrogenase family enzyme